MDSVAGEHPPHLDVVFGTLQNRRRRLVLRYLADNPETTQGELAEHIAAIENETTVDQVTSKQRKRVYVALYQSHLPKLHDGGSIAFDRNRGTVKRVSSTDQYLRYLDRFESARESRSGAGYLYSYGGAAILTAALFASIVTGGISGQSLFSIVAAAVFGWCVLAAGAD